MKNISNTEAYTFFDTIFSQSVISLSRVIGVKNITRPFWNRWRASLIGNETINGFLQSIKSLNDWPHAAKEIIKEEERLFELTEESMDLDSRIRNLRRLSYLCHMGQWGCLAIDETKRTLYARSRDFYIRSEKMAHNRHFQRIIVPWKSKFGYANLHLPKDAPAPYPLILILHGMDDTKEEHLSTILFLQEKGFAVLCADGPGQGESLFMSDLKWESDYCDFMEALITKVCDEHNCDRDNTGLLGISWGGMWAIKSASEIPGIKAVYDLGGPIDTRLFSKLPFFLKTKFCQVLGISHPKQIPDYEKLFSITDENILKKVNCPVRVVHGGKDPIVPVSDKEWLVKKLKELHPRGEVSLVVHKLGDHCCTGQAEECRIDVNHYFGKLLMQTAIA